MTDDTKALIQTIEASTVALIETIHIHCSNAENANEYFWEAYREYGEKMKRIKGETNE